MDKMDHNSINLVIPVTLAHLKLLMPNINFLKLCLPISKIVIIGDREIKAHINEDASLLFIDENSLVSDSSLRKAIACRSNDVNVSKRSGWYLQQFLKMAYARVCLDDYYLLWDCDTIPLQEINLFDESGKPYIDYKTEYNKQYFETMGRLLPGYDKVFGGSFIAEHMLINTNHMKELLNQIESNIEIKGNSFYEKIINAVEIRYLTGSGFSEFETFGTFLYKNYREYYSFRRWKSMRNGGFFYKLDEMTKNERLWLAKNYHAISFEKKDKLSVISNMIRTRWFMNFFPPQILELFSVFLRIYRKTKN